MNVGKKEEQNCSQQFRPSSDDVVHRIQDNCTISSEKCQCIDKELEEKWTPKKQEGESLVMCYYRLGYEEKAKRVADCGTFLEFARYGGMQEGAGGLPRGGVPCTGDSFKLHRANFCRDRLCPMCSWRRSYKIFGQVSQIMDLIADKYEFLFLTLTVPNCTADELINTLNRMTRAWTKLFHYKRVERILKGFFKALEITYNQTADTYHPHFHVVLAVPKSYFNSRDYLHRDEWLSMWQKAMNDSSITQVDIRKARDKHKEKIGKTAAEKLASAVAEIAKYAVKSSDYLFDDEELTDKVVSVLVPALSDRRLCSFGGCFKEAHQALQLDDTENGDLIHIDGELRSDVALQIYRYGWSCGAYKLIEVIDKANILAEYDE